MSTTSTIYNEASGIVGTLKDGRTLAKGTKTQVVNLSPFYIEINIPNLSKLDAIVDLNIKTIDPAATVYGVCQKKISRGPKNDIVIGFTVGFATGLTATGSTVTAEAVVIGW